MYGEKVPQNEQVRLGSFKVTLASVGNPDFRQCSTRSLPGVPRLTVVAASMLAAASACREYIAEHDLGGGNWAGGDITLDGKLVARVSYNGQIWYPEGIEVATATVPEQIIPVEVRLAACVASLRECLGFVEAWQMHLNDIGSDQASRTVGEVFQRARTAYRSAL